jgi:hypothetical protein
VVGAVINVPGIYYLSALHDLATGDYSNTEQIALVEVPLVSYAISPEKTAERMHRFQEFLTSNRRGSSRRWRSRSASC